MKILLGMSGGLDSAYAALKLKKQGYEVEGAVLKMHSYTELAAARAAAESVGIVLHEVDCTDRFERTVVKNFLDEYRAGRTPNPCVICNSEVKFICLYDYAVSKGFSAIATGHYSSVVAIDKDGTAIENTPELISEGNCDRFHYAVRRGEDLKKDQSYMLWRLPQYVLSKLLLPLSDEEKSSVRAEAQRAGLSVAEREESQEICFVPDGDYASFIETRTAPSPHGCFVDEEGNVLGEHKGIIRYTLGQRRGLGISSSSRIFVTDIDIEKNTITLSANDKYTDSLTVTDFVFSGITGPDSGSELCLSVKLRYAAPPVPCRVTFDGNRATVTLSTSVRAVTPGQSAVFYDKDILAFGGFIQ